MHRDYKLSPPKALVIDDEPELAELISAVFTREGYQVTKAANGQEALAEVINHRFDVVATDLDMPKLGGVGFIQRLRKTPQKEVPVVVFSGKLNKEWVQELAGLNVTKVFLKPFKIEELLQTVNKVLEYDSKMTAPIEKNSTESMPKIANNSNNNEDEFEVNVN